MQKLSKNKASYIRSLSLKKHRDEDRVFVAEGSKTVAELLPHFEIVLVVATKEWLLENENRLSCSEEMVFEASEEDLRRVSFQQHPQQVLAVLKQREASLNIEKIQDELTIALDGVRDPGNLGTIIRLADWFGIGTIVCSQDSVDVFNPKVVQATMGSIARVNVVYGNLMELIEALPQGFPIYGTLLDGDNIYAQKLTRHGLIVMGNEGVGISEEVRTKVNRRLFIPNFSHNSTTAESLNVAVATAIVCSEFRRNESK